MEGGCGDLDRGKGSEEGSGDRDDVGGELGVKGLRKRFGCLLLEEGIHEYTSMQNL